MAILILRFRFVVGHPILLCRDSRTIPSGTNPWGWAHMCYLPECRRRSSACVAWAGIGFYIRLSDLSVGGLGPDSRGGPEHPMKSKTVPVNRLKMLANEHLTLQWEERAGEHRAAITRRSDWLAVSLTTSFLLPPRRDASLVNMFT